MDLHDGIKIALYAGIVQGLFLALFLPRLAKTNREANKLLALMLFLASVSTFLFLNTVYLSKWSVRTHAFLDTIPFLFAPLFYLYVKKLLFVYRKTGYVWIHFIPALLHFLYGGSTLLRYSEQQYADMLASDAFRMEWVVIFSVLCLLLLSYCLASYRLLQVFREEKEKVLSYRQNVNYLRIVLITLFISYLVCIVYSLDFFFDIEIFSFTGMNLGWIVIPVLIYLVSYFAFMQPDAMRVSYPETKKPVRRIHEKSLDSYKQKLEDIMRNQKLYLDPELKLNGLADKVQLEATKLSWLINQTYGTNFYDFVNRYRIEAFIGKLKNGEHKCHTLLALAYEVGFNSKTTFNKSFKKELQTTPSAYIKKIHKEDCLSQPYHMAKPA